jgi:hypothetical protein
MVMISRRRNRSRDEKYGKEVKGEMTYVNPASSTTISSTHQDHTSQPYNRQQYPSTTLHQHQSDISYSHFLLRQSPTPKHSFSCYVSDEDSNLLCTDIRERKRRSLALRLGGRCVWRMLRGIVLDRLRRRKVRGREHLRGLQRVAVRGRRRGL